MSDLEDAVIMKGRLGGRIGLEGVDVEERINVVISFGFFECNVFRYILDREAGVGVGNIFADNDG